MDKKMNAKKEMLKHLSKEMRDMIGDGYGEKMKKITIASDSEEGLKEGLSKAEEIMKAKGLLDEDSDEEMEEEYEDESEEDEESEDDKKASLMEALKNRKK
tara:strand:- start:1370 stop:1672 length:303 start_codon:yes stop_codon:yes gene_type:complete